MIINHFFQLIVIGRHLTSFKRLSKYTILSLLSFDLIRLFLVVILELFR